jgi:hypothetical protein
MAWRVNQQQAWDCQNQIQLLQKRAAKLLNHRNRNKRSADGLRYLAGL